jgi:hypothetical protein
MAESRIEWTDYTFNPWWGCERVSPGCAHCYADTLAIRYGHRIWGKDHGFRFFGDKHWDEPLKWAARAERDGVRRRVFCASMADVFEERPSSTSTGSRLLFDLIEETPHLDWQILTKRPSSRATGSPTSTTTLAVWPEISPVRCRCRTCGWACRSRTPATPGAPTSSARSPPPSGSSAPSRSSAASTPTTSRSGGRAARLRSGTGRST